ncbi:general stress protein [Peribacillus sp. FSL H8-0477]|uniref:general stress protein n=1 Tax=Peribacillus sp. FSL H8-0477 TaxID=2921388 RepID=UPI0030F9B6B4
METKVYGVFHQNEAIQEIQALQAKGYKGKEITVLAKSEEELERLGDNGLEHVKTFSDEDDESLVDKVARIFMNIGKEDLTDKLAGAGLSDTEAHAYMKEINEGKVVVLVNEGSHLIEGTKAGYMEQVKPHKQQNKKDYPPVTKTSVPDGEKTTYQTTEELEQVKDLESRQPVSDPNADPVSSKTKESNIIRREVANEADDVQLDNDGNAIIHDEQLKNRINTDHL